MLSKGRQLQLANRINQWFIRTAGGDDRPSILDIDAIYPELRRLEDAFPKIRAEALALLADRERVPTIQEVENQSKCLSSFTPHNWRQFWLWSLGEMATENCARCPETVRAIQQVPRVRQAHFSILDPGKAVAAHSGHYAGLLRYHLGLIVPTENPPQLRVHERLHTWREGEGVLFDDTREHEVFNTCGEPRIVLVLDVPRRMPFPHTMAQWLVSRMARRAYSRPQIQRVRELAEQ